MAPAAAASAADATGPDDASKMTGGSILLRFGVAGGILGLCVAVGALFGLSDPAVVGIAAFLMAILIEPLASWVEVRPGSGPHV